MADNTIDVVKKELDDGTPTARVTVRSENQTDVGATLDKEAADAHIRAIADAFGWTVTVVDPGAVDSSDSDS